MSIDAALDRVDPRAAGIRHDNAGRAEHRQAADDAEPGVHRLLGEVLAAGDRDGHDKIGGGCAIRLGELGERLGDHRARRRVDRRLADRQCQTWAGHGADPLAGAEMDTGAGRRPGKLGDDQRAMRDVGVVAGVLDDAGTRPAIALFGERQREFRGLAARQTDRNGIGETAGQQCLECGAGRGGGARPRRPAPA
jgi:hypothetical protein